MTRDDIIWAAGFFDGEGTVGAYNGAVIAAVVNTYRPSVVWLQDRFGGSVVKVRDQHDHVRAAWRWTVCGSAARRFLSTVLPWLQEKLPQAEVALSMRVWARGTRPSVEDQWCRDLKCAEIKRLKGRI